jgi:hypothetical protein
MSPPTKRSPPTPFPSCPLIFSRGAQAHDDAGQPSYPGPQKSATRDLTNVMAIAITGDYEGVLSAGIGMRKQTWIKASTLSSPTRVVIDVGR